MSAVAEFTLPGAQVRKLLGGIARQTGQTTVQLLNDVMALWARDLVRETYPKSAGQGKRRVEKDIRQVFGTETQFDDASIRQSFQKGNEFEINNSALRFRPRMKSADLRPVHEQQRTRRGRVNRGARSGLIVPERVLKRYVRERQKGVGRLKSGWAAAAAHYKLSVPGWVATHGTGEGEFIPSLDPVTMRGSLVAVNKVPYAASKLGGRFMDFLQSKRIRDLTSGHYVKRWQKRLERSLDKMRAAA